MTDSIVKIVVLIVGGTIAISLLENNVFGTNVGAIGKTFADILSAMRGSPTTQSTATPQGPQPAG